MNIKYSSNAQQYQDSQIVHEYRRQLQQLKDDNLRLQGQNLELNKKNQELYQQLKQKNFQIQQLEAEIRNLNFIISNNERQSIISTTSSLGNPRMSQRKKIFETTLHQTNLSPKNGSQESPQAEYLEQYHQKVIIKDVRVYNYSPEIQHNKRVDEIILKYSKASPQIKQISPPKFLLYEEFFIISVSKQTIQQSHKDCDRIFSLQPEVLFQHPQNKNKYADQFVVLPTMIYPYGVQVKLEEKTLSMSNLNSIIMGGQSYDRLSGAYVIIMKSDQSFNQQQDLPEKYDLNEIDDIILLGNRQNHLYCVCLDVLDFYDYEQSPQGSQRGSARRKPSMEKKYFYQVQKTYCFVTKAPLINYFIDVLRLITNTLKYKKAEIYSMISDAEESLQNIDNTFYISYKPELFKFLKDIQLSRNIEQCSHHFLQSSTSNPKIFHGPQYFEIEWCLQYALQSMDVVHYITFVLLLLLESNICLISYNKTLLSSLLILLPKLIKPFPFIHPTIFSISQQLLPMFDSPVPFLCGMHKDQADDFLPLEIEHIDDFIEENKQVVFYDADTMHFSNLPMDFRQSNIHNTLLYQLFQKFEQFRSLNTPGLIIQDNFESNLDLGIQILQLTQTFIQNNIIDKHFEDEITGRIHQTQYWAFYMDQLK